MNKSVFFIFCIIMISCGINSNNNSTKKEEASSDTSHQTLNSVEVDSIIEKVEIDLKNHNPEELLHEINEGKIGVSFHGITTEPFIDIYITENEILYMNHGAVENIIYAIEKTFDEHIKSQIITGKNSEGKSIKLSISKEPSGDGMSDRTYPYKIIIDNEWTGGGDSKLMSNLKEYEK